MAFATTERAPDATPRLYWLHVPKCGTTFSNLFVRAACPHVVSDDEFRTPVRPATLKNAKDCAFAFGGFRIGHPPVTERHWKQVNGGMVTILRRPASRVASTVNDDLLNRATTASSCKRRPPPSRQRMAALALVDGSHTPLPQHLELRVELVRSTAAIVCRRVIRCGKRAGETSAKPAWE